MTKRCFIRIFFIYLFFVPDTLSVKLEKFNGNHFTLFLFFPFFFKKRENLLDFNTFFFLNEQNFAGFQ